MSRVVALDTSAAVPLVARDHRHHQDVSQWLGTRSAAFPEHALVETYSVLTRMPQTLRSEPADVAQVLATRFSRPLLLKPATARRLPEIFAARGIAGGAVYDALVALAAMENDCILGTRDNRARSTYERLGATVEFAGAS